MRSCDHLLLTLTLFAACSPGKDLPAKKTPDVPRPVHAIAHRGASGHAPENTVPAFERALALGAEHVELDVRLSRDNVLVLFHDSTLDEKTDRRGSVRDFTEAELTTTDIGSWFDRTHPGSTERFAGTTLVTLREVFQRFGPRFVYHVEIKGKQRAIPGLLVKEIAAAGLRDRVTVTSFSPQQLGRVRADDRDLPLCLLIKPERPDQAKLGGSVEAIIDAAAAAGFEQVGVRASEVSPALVKRARERDLSLRAWKVRSQDDVARVVAAGADGMTLDHPEWLLER